MTESPAVIILKESLGHARSSMAVDEAHIRTLEEEIVKTREAVQRRRVAVSEIEAAIANLSS